MPSAVERSAPPAVRVAALFFWGRSCTVFLHSLFDGHPEVLTFPAAAAEVLPEMVAIGAVPEPVRSLAAYLRKNRDLAARLGQDDRAGFAKMASTGGYNALYRHQLAGWSELFDRRPMPRYQVRL